MEGRGLLSSLDSKLFNSIPDVTYHLLAVPTSSIVHIEAAEDVGEEIEDVN